MAKEHILNTWKILKTKKPFMDSFMDNYLCKQISVPRTRLLSNKENYEKVIDFCLRTRRNPNGPDLRKAKKHFYKNFDEFKMLLKKGEFKQLQELVNQAPGVGQKIGALILEVFIFYGANNSKLIKELYVPLDAHTIRMFDEALNMKNVPKKYSDLKTKLSPFQDELSSHLPANGERIYFDYLWFIGKVFCQKITKSKNSYSRGYRLCNMCWINNYCQINPKWDYSSINKTL